MLNLQVNVFIEINVTKLSKAINQKLMFDMFAHWQMAYVGNRKTAKLVINRCLIYNFCTFLALSVSPHVSVCGNILTSRIHQFARRLVTVI